MKLIVGILLLVLSLTSCGIINTSAYKKKPKTTYNSNSKVSKQKRVVQYAKSYLGTRYRYGGTSKKGMDCSGLVYTSFKQINVSLPRVSYEMSKKGKAIKKREIQSGDLVFFRTSKKNSRAVNHVGVVSKVSSGIVYFIHSSSSKGVIESNLENPYWKKSYKFSKRIL